ncbi:MAG: multidrug efflux RND transporter permease subunit [Kiritimatiellaeota bacterium]|nr:multidrug efflux RND transporter permease subunit [Kiritimatiellota bacterium]
MFSEFFIHHPRFAFVISIVITLSGVLAIMSLPVAQYPTITPSQVTVSTSYPGANAKTVEETVITPIETQINGVKKMMYMSSKSSNDGSATIQVTLDIGSDGDLNTVNTKNREGIAEPQLPEDVKRQGVVVQEQSSNMLCIVDLHSSNPKIDQLYLSNYMLIHLQDAIARVPGVGNVSMFGNWSYAIRIWLDPDRLSSLGLTVEDVQQAIQEQNLQAPVGSIGSSPTSPRQQFTYTLQAKGRLSDVKEFQNIIIKATENGSYVRVKDVAKVELGSVDYSVDSSLDGHPAALLAVYQLPSANALAVVRDVRQVMEGLKGAFPKGVEYGMVYDTTQFIEASINEVVSTLFIAVFLVVLITYIFLQDWRATLIPALAIPVSLVGTFAALLALGYSINLITLFGLILAIGIVVDDAITVIESVKRKMDVDGLDPVEATVLTMRLVTSPVIATTLVLMAVFVPVMFLSGMTGILYRQFAVTISISVLISSLNALTLSPALCASLMKPGVKPLAIFGPFNRMFDKLTIGYMNWVKRLVRKLAVVFLLFAALIAASYIIYKNLPTGFIPTEDQGFFMMAVQLPAGAALPRTSRVVDKIRSFCRKEENIAHVLCITGYDMLAGIPAPNTALIIAILKPWDERKASGQSQKAIMRRVQDDLNTIPEANVFAFGTPAIPGLGTTGGFEFVLQDRGNGTSRELAEVMGNLMVEANKNPALAKVYSSYQADVPQIYLTIDRDKVKKLGIELSSVFNALQANLGSLYVNDFNKYGKTFKVMLQAEKSYRDNIKKINTIYVRSAKGEMVPLSTLVSRKYILGPQIIEHYNLYRSCTINGDAAPGYSSGEAMNAMEKVAEEHLPQGYGYEWTGMSFQEKLAGNQVFWVMLMAITFIYLFLVAQYESWMIPFAVMLSVPIAFFGALAALALFGLANNIYTQVGFVLLFGLASKTAILIVEFAKDEHEKGRSIIEAAEAAANLRFRAVLMTALSFVLGVIPLVLATGAGAESRRSLGTAVLGGMLVSAVFATILVPAFYVLIQKMIERGKKT